MKTLVIHPHDESTDFLSPIYEGHDWTVIRDYMKRSELRELMKQHDRIIMLGHGMPIGLIGHGRIFIGAEYVDILREKECVCIWCNADKFVEHYGLRGFYTGMIISEVQEARVFGITVTQEVIDESNTLFARAIKESIMDPEMLDVAQRIYIGEGPIIDFNKVRMYFTDVTIIDERKQDMDNFKRYW